MKFISKLLVILLVIIMLLPIIGCGRSNSGEGREIISSIEAIELFNDEDIVIIDAQKSASYTKEHIEGSVNISRADIVINEPVLSMLAPVGQIEEVLGRKGISNESKILIYDSNNNMDSARLWWTLKVYGHDYVKVISGGLIALKEAGASVSKELPDIIETEYIASGKDSSLIADLKEVISQVEEPDEKPDENIFIIDVRNKEEYDSGAIPGSILIDYIGNNYNDGTYRSVQNIKIIYIEKGIKSDKTAIIYCKSSVRGAQTLLALYNAGYRNLKLYDGGWIEWSADESLPVQLPAAGSAPVEESGGGCG